MKKLSLFLVALVMILVSCKPEIENPTVVTKSVGKVTETTASILGEVISDGGAEVTSRGVCWNTVGNPSVLDNCTQDGTGIGEYTSNLTDLTPNTTYYVKAYAMNSEGISYGEEKTFTTVNIVAPTIVTKDVVNITKNSAESGGNVTSDGGEEVTARGVCWSTKENPTISDSHTTDGDGIGEYVSNMTGLEDGTTYYVRAYATNSKGTSYGEEKTFTTVNVVVPTIVTKDVTNITQNSAVSGGNITDDGGEEVTARGVCWSTKENPTISDSHTTDGDGTGEYVSNMTGLEDGTTYYVRAYATNGKGTSYGEEKTFTTVNIVAPTIVTKDVVNITKNSAESGGNVTSDGGEEVTARGICWSTKENPTISDSHTTDGKGTGEYVSNMTGLKDGTTYYVRAYATNSKGTSYGEQKTFTTVKVGAPTIVTKDVTNITRISAVSGGNVTDDGNDAVTARGICWSTKENPTISDSHTTDGKGTGEYVSNMTGLKDGTTYYVRAYATNSKGTSYGVQKTFTTIKILLPTVETGKVTNITSNSAVCVGNITSDGGDEMLFCGFCWSITHNPTVDDSYIPNNFIFANGSFESTLFDLTPNMTYYVRAYAGNEAGIAYGENVSFTTKDFADAVDLGLSVKWATCNVGASSPEGYGKYYAWGETTTKETYTSSNCLTYGLSISQLQSQGYIDSEGNLAPQYDVATANWGGEWRMPTEDELYELNNKCTWTWTTQNGVKGYKVKGPNGNSIFLPAAGYHSTYSSTGIGDYGNYWSSTPNKSVKAKACSLSFICKGDHYNSGEYRDYGMPVRPVIE